MIIIIAITITIIIIAIIMIVNIKLINSLINNNNIFYIKSINNKTILIII
jgi:hypothetical protein